MITKSGLRRKKKGKKREEKTGRTVTVHVTPNFRRAGFRSRCTQTLQQCDQSLVTWSTRLPLEAALPPLQVHVLIAWQHQRKESFFSPIFSTKALGLTLNGSDWLPCLPLNRSPWSGRRRLARPGPPVQSRARVKTSSFRLWSESYRGGFPLA